MVLAGETLHDIAQAEGIRMESLTEYNHVNADAALETWRQSVSATRCCRCNVPVSAFCYFKTTKPKLLYAFSAGTGQAI